MLALFIPSGIIFDVIKLTDNFLRVEDHQKLLQCMLSEGILPWKYNQRKVATDLKGKEVADDLGNYQFTHLFYTFHSVTGNTRHVISQEIDLVKPILDRISFIALHRVKANLEPVKPERYMSEWHYDVAMNNKPCKSMTTAIYYVNTCDGYTEFEDGTKVECVANRLVWFPSDIKHRGVSQLDTKVKSVINLNYFQL
tara:strand:- start:2111 stop:2701 length:591 start_codon:yes stop_codon:yes gene_type:complete